MMCHVTHFRCVHITVYDLHMKGVKIDTPTCAA